MSKKRPPLPRFFRANKAPAIRLQQRDIDLMKSIQEFGGFMTRRQIQLLFWPNNSHQAMQLRLSKLFHNSYLNWPDEGQRKSQLIPEPIVWLDWKGIITLAEIQGLGVSAPKRTNENQLRLLQRRLHERDLRWLRQPNWSLLQHDVAVGNFHLQVMTSAIQHPKLRLDHWISESHFRSKSKQIRFSYRNNSGQWRSRKKAVIPDSCFELIDEERKNRGDAYKARFLVELDMATHENSRFGVEKVAAGLAWMQSENYHNEFGDNNGRWLVLTSSQKRMANLRVQCDLQAGDHSGLFFFTTFELISESDPLNSPIWFPGDQDSPVSLLE